MNTTLLLFLQSMLVTIQVLNAGMAAVFHNEAATLVVGAVAGGLQFFLQHVGNQTEPTK